MGHSCNRVEFRRELDTSGARDAECGRPPRVAVAMRAGEDREGVELLWQSIVKRARSKIDWQCNMELAFRIADRTTPVGQQRA